MGATPKELPQEITKEILCRLPIKSLLRFRCVCKCWFHWLSRDPHFSKLLHFHKQLRSHSPSLIALAPEKPLRLYYASDYTACHEAIKFDAPFPESSSFFGNYAIFGVCNGLICIGNDSGNSWNIHIWNPLTSDHIVIPNPPPVRNYHRALNSLGFGFHEDINEYKVIRLVHIVEGWDYSTQVGVHTLGTNSWRILKEIPYVVSSHSSHVILVSGSLHWLAKKTASPSWKTILSFDIKDEAFREIPLPNVVTYNNSCKVRVGESGGLLSVFWHYDQKMQIWSLKDYGAGDSWMKLCEVQQSGVPTVSFRRSKLIGLASNHKIIMKAALNLSLYNPQNNSITELRKFKGYIDDVFAYHERLTSLQIYQCSQ